MTNNNEERTVDERLAALESPLHQMPDAVKEAMKEAITEWLDQKFMLVGKFTVNGFLAAALAALVYAILIHQGWKQTP